jgi:hypothetical protein
LKGATVRRLRIEGNARTAATGIEIAENQFFRNTIEDVSIGNVGTGILAGQYRHRAGFWARKYALVARPTQRDPKRWPSPIAT